MVAHDHAIDVIVMGLYKYRQVSNIRHTLIGN